MPDFAGCSRRRHLRRPPLPQRGRDEDLTTPQTGNLPTGFFQNDTSAITARNTVGASATSCAHRTTESGNALARDVPSRRRVGHPGSIDPMKGVAYVLMVQRSNSPNSDASDVRRAFQGLPHGHWRSGERPRLLSARRTTAACHGAAARQHDDATTRRRDETKILASHFDGLLPAGGAARRAVAGVRSGGSQAAVCSLRCL